MGAAQALSGEFDAVGNSLVVWAAPTISEIESGSKLGLSCAYRYTPVMEPVTHKGQRADGWMRDIAAREINRFAAAHARDPLQIRRVATKMRPLTPRKIRLPCPRAAFRFDASAHASAPPTPQGFVRCARSWGMPKLSRRTS